MFGWTFQFAHAQAEKPQLPTSHSHAHIKNLLTKSGTQSLVLHFC